MEKDKNVSWLHKEIKKKYIAMFIGNSEQLLKENEQIDLHCQHLAEKFGWNRSMARKNMEVFARQVWMRLKNK
jgi:hypothetical protein